MGRPLAAPRTQYTDGGPAPRCHPVHHAREAPCAPWQAPTRRGSTSAGHKQDGRGDQEAQEDRHQGIAGCDDEDRVGCHALLREPLDRPTRGAPRPVHQARDAREPSHEPDPHEHRGNPEESNQESPRDPETGAERYPSQSPDGSPSNDSHKHDHGTHGAADEARDNRHENDAEHTRAAKVGIQKTCPRKSDHPGVNGDGRDHQQAPRGTPHQILKRT